MCYERRDPNIARECWERDQRSKKMAEYIEREKVRDEFYQCVLDGTITSVEDTGKFLRDFPAADVEPVVHCRDCVYNGLDSMPHTKDKCYRLMLTCFAVKPEGFCAWGRKKDGE